MLISAPILLSLLVGISVLAIVVGVRSMFVATGPNERIQEILGSATDEPPTLRDLEMQASFYERTLRPLGKSILQTLGRMAPQRNLLALQSKIDSAGTPGGLGVMDFLGLKISLCIILGLLFAVMPRLIRPDLSLTVVLLLGGVAGFAGFASPNFWLSSKVSARQAEILKALPDALDMMTICVQAGLGLSGAMQRICDNWNNSLADEFARVLAETRLGRSRIDALEALGQRTGVEEVISFVIALTMAERMGANIAQVLQVQAKQMRIARRQRAEKLAREASIKMLFPLVFLIFPAMFAVILGPAVPILLETF